MRTVDIARATGISVNTVRQYEALGYLPPVPRASNGYRQFSNHHVLHVRLIRKAMLCTWIGGDIRQRALDSIRHAADGVLDQALTTAHELFNQLNLEQERAEKAALTLEHWAAGKLSEQQQPVLRIGAVAKRLGVSIDGLRNWERNGLITIPRSSNGYRAYTSTEIARLSVIRTLRQARYSTMSILRMFQVFDQGQIGNLGKILDSPAPQDDIIYATDHWLSTVKEMVLAAEAMIDLILELQTLH